MQPAFRKLPHKLRPASSTAERGVALVVVLIFIVALTSLAIYSARDVSLGERIARNQLDAQVAREAAEAALRDAEFDLLLSTGIIRTNANCSRGALRPVIEAVFEFTPGCATGQCGLPQSLYDSSNYSTATTTTLAMIVAPATITGEPWWPGSKGGQWNDVASTKPSRASPISPGLNCAFAGGVPYGTFTGRPPIVGVSRQPEYLIEYLLVGKFYRVSARGFGRNPTTEIMLQSYFRPFQ